MAMTMPSIHGSVTMLLSFIIVLTLIPSVASGQEIASPYTGYEVEPPPIIPVDGAPCSFIILEHDFNDYTPVTKQYTPPTHCGDPSKWASAILTVYEHSKGIQYDRLGTIALSHVELWRTSTAEPRVDENHWTTSKDITNYLPILKKPGLLLFSEDNVVDNVDDGKYHTILTLSIYPETETFKVPPLPDLILPLGPPSTTSSTWSYPSDNAVRTHTIPRNTVAMFAEITSSGASDEEFWYELSLDAMAKEVFGVLGKGPYRDTELYIDGQLAGYVAPFPVIYTGGEDPLWWEPLVSIGAFNAKSYWIDLTAFVGTLTDDQPHEYRLAVCGQGANHSVNSKWLVTGNLQLRLNKESEERTTGKVLQNTLPLAPTFQVSTFTYDDKIETITQTVVAQREGHVIGYIFLPQEAVLTTVTTTISNSFTDVQYIQGNYDSVTNVYSSGSTKTVEDSGKITFSYEFNFPMTMPMIANDLYYLTVDHSYTTTITYPSFTAYAAFSPSVFYSVSQSAHDSEAFTEEQTVPPHNNTVTLAYVNGMHTYYQNVSSVGFSIASSDVSGTIPQYSNDDPPPVPLPSSKKRSRMDGRTSSIKARPLPHKLAKRGRMMKLRDGRRRLHRQP